MEFAGRSAGMARRMTCRPQLKNRRQQVTLGFPARMGLEE
jgi:hypothetical protein